MVECRGDFFKKLAVVLIILLVVTLLYMVASNHEPIQRTIEVFKPIPAESFTSSEATIRFRAQRDDLSKQLNDLKKQYGQQSCEQLKLQAAAGKGGDSRISENGGWCAEMSGPDSSAHRFDQGLARALSKFFAGKTVGSFGDGPGMYKLKLDELGEVKSYTAYDGAPYTESTTKGVVRFLDLTAPHYGLPIYDWVMSLEVGEHIPAKFEDVYLDNLARHAREGILLSWAIPGQGGLSHVNNKPLEDVVKQMNRRGFDIDKPAGEPLRNASSFYWLKANTHVYRRVSPDTLREEDA